MNLKTHIIFFFFINFSFSQTPVVLWEQEFGGVGSSFYGVLKTNSGEFILSGGYYQYAGGERLTVKMDTNNQLIWENDNIGSGVTKGVVMQNDGYIYTVTYSNPPNPSAFSLFQYDDDGVLTNEWSYPHADVLYVTKLVATQDGGFLMSGHKTTPESGGIAKNGWAAKISAAKAVEWETEISSVYGMELRTSAQTTDGDFLVAGHKSDENGTNDFYLAKLDALGDLIWEKEYDYRDSEEIWAVTELANGNYICAGNSAFFNGDMNVWTSVTDTEGNLLSEQIITNGFLSFTESSIIAEPDGGYTIGAYNYNCSENSSFNFNIQRFNAANETIWNLCLTEGNLYDIVKTDDDGYIAVGLTGPTGATRAYALKIGTLLGNESFELQNTGFYPNPTNGILYIKSNIIFNSITIYTVDGKKVMSEQLQNNQINVEQLSQSLYLATLVTDNGQEVNLKFVKI